MIIRNRKYLGSFHIMRRTSPYNDIHHSCLHIDSFWHVETHTHSYICEQRSWARSWCVAAKNLAAEKFCCFAALLIRVNIFVDVWAVFDCLLLGFSWTGTWTLWHLVASSLEWSGHVLQVLLGRVWLRRDFAALLIKLNIGICGC